MFKRLAWVVATALLQAGTVALGTPAQASPAIQSVISPGDVINAAVSVSGGTVEYTFSGSIGQHITFDVTASDWGGSTARLNLFGPNGSFHGYISLSSGSGTWGDFTLNAEGTWKVVVDPNLTAIGTATFKFATDINGGALTSEATVNASIDTRGQDDFYSFSGTAGAHVTFDVPATNWGASASANIVLYGPTGTQFGYFNLYSSATFGDFTLNASGTWKMVLSPNGPATGSASFKFALDINGGQLTSGVAVTTAIDIRGQNAVFTLSGANGQHLTINVPATNWGAASLAQIQLYRPNGSYFGYVNLYSSAVSWPLTLDAAGTWTLVLNPVGAATGYADITVS